MATIQIMAPNSAAHAVTRKLIKEHLYHVPITYTLKDHPASSPSCLYAVQHTIFTSMYRNQAELVCFEIVAALSTIYDLSHSILLYVLWN